MGHSQALEILQTQKGQLLESTLLPCRVRYYTDGANLGSAAFVRSFADYCQRKRGESTPEGKNLCGARTGVTSP